MAGRGVASCNLGLPAPRRRLQVCLAGAVLARCKCHRHYCVSEQYATGIGRNLVRARRGKTCGRLRAGPEISENLGCRFVAAAVFGVSVCTYVSVQDGDQCSALAMRHFRGVCSWIAVLNGNICNIVPVWCGSSGVPQRPSCLASGSETSGNWNIFQRFQPLGDELLQNFSDGHRAVGIPRAWVKIVLHGMLRKCKYHSPLASGDLCRHCPLGHDCHG